MVEASARHLELMKPHTTSRFFRDQATTALLIHRMVLYQHLKPLVESRWEI